MTWYVTGTNLEGNDETTFVKWVPVMWHPLIQNYLNIPCNMRSNKPSLVLYMVRWNNTCIHVPPVTGTN